MKSRLLAAAVVAAGGLTAAIPGAAPAATQPVSGTVAAILGLAVPTPVALSPLTPGQTSTGTGTMGIIANVLDPWVLRISDAGVTGPGHLQRTVGTGGATQLATALSWTATPLAGTAGSGTLTATPQTAASGTGPTTLTTGYSQPVGAGESLVTGNTYGLTVTWTISPT
jgi:hypothetical protein